MCTSILTYSEEIYRAYGLVVFSDYNFSTISLSGESKDRIFILLLLFLDMESDSIANLISCFKKCTYLRKSL